jgi:cephalosporin-C deacetylase-like acetyl esterase
MNVIQNGEISHDFLKIDKTLIPLVFCHGHGANRTLCSQQMKEFASHGYIVFALDYHDGSSSYVEMPDGINMYFDDTTITEDLIDR